MDVEGKLVFAHRAFAAVNAGVVGGLRMKRRDCARLGARRLLVVMMIVVSGLPLMAAGASLLTAQQPGDAQFILEMLLPAVLTFVAGNIMALIVVRRCGRRPLKITRRARSVRGSSTA